MHVEEVKSVSGKPVFEVRHHWQTVSDPFVSKADAKWHMFHLKRLRGTANDPLADFWAHANKSVTAHLYEIDEGSDDPRAIEGGGGRREKLVGVIKNRRRYQIEAYVRAYYNRYGDLLTIRYQR